MPVVTVLDSFLKTIILVRNYRLRFKISGSGPTGTLHIPFEARSTRLIRFWTDTLCPPGVTVTHAVALVAIVCHTCVDVCCAVLLCTRMYKLLCCSVLLCVCFECAVLMCIYVFLLVRVCIFGNLFGISTNEAQFS